MMNITISDKEKMEGLQGYHEWLEEMLAQPDTHEIYSELTQDFYTHEYKETEQRELTEFNELPF
jgi:hypothetical protein